MSKRLILLISVFIALLFYFTVYSIRSPFKNALFPIIYFKTSQEILPNAKPSPNTHEILLKSGSNINGELISDDHDTYVIHEHKNNHTFTEHTIKQDDTLSISVKPQTLPVSSSEIIARQEFPEMKFYRFKNYTLFSDSGFSSIGPTAGILKKLHADLTKAFPGIIASNNNTNRICVVLFSKSEEYQNFVKGFNPAFVTSNGCYSPDHNILFINNDSSVRARQAYSSNTIRHEGVHQIFYNAKLHFGWNIDRLWLVEGLAVYCESAQLGERAGFRQQYIKKALRQNRQFPTTKLLSKYTVDDKKSSLFYNQSWAFIYFLANNYPDEFMEYLAYIKNHPFLSWHKGDTKLLETFIGKKIELIENEFKKFWL